MSGKDLGDRWTAAREAVDRVYEIDDIRRDPGAARDEIVRLKAEVSRLTRENAVLADDAARAPRFVPFAGGEIS